MKRVNRLRHASILGWMPVAMGWMPARNPVECESPVAWQPGRSSLGGSFGDAGYLLVDLNFKSAVPYLSLLTGRGLLEVEVNYHGLKAVACDYAKSRVASGGLTKPPWASRIYLKSRVRCSIFIAPTLSAWVS